MLVPINHTPATKMICIEDIYFENTKTEHNGTNYYLLVRQHGNVGVQEDSSFYGDLETNKEF